YDYAVPMGLAMNSTSPPPPRTSESSPHWFQQHCRYRFEGQHPHQLRSQLPACTAQIIQNLLFQRYRSQNGRSFRPSAWALMLTNRLFRHCPCRDAMIWGCSRTSPETIAKMRSILKIPVGTPPGLEIVPGL